MRRIRSLSVACSFSLASAILAGCEPQPAPTPATPTLPPPTRSIAADSGSIERVPLTADQLAGILNINVWSLKYSGAPLVAWIEIDEKGQSTMPKRIPEKGEVGSGGESAPSSGTVLFYWRRFENNEGGLMTLNNGGSYGYGIGKSAFVFDWKSFSSQWNGIELATPLSHPPGESFTMLRFNAKEFLSADEKKPPREIELRLMGKFRMAPPR